MSDLSNTQFFQVEPGPQISAKDILEIVFKALKEKGYNPVNQIVGYIMSGDPTYITSYNGARSLVMKVERDELVEERKNIDDTQNFIADIYNNKNGINYETANSTLNNTAKVEEPKLENNDKQNLAEPINTVAKESMAENTGTIAQEPNYKNFDEHKNFKPFQKKRSFFDQKY